MKNTIRNLIRTLLNIYVVEDKDINKLSTNLPVKNTTLILENSLSFKLSLDGVIITGEDINSILYKNLVYNNNGIETMKKIVGYDAITGTFTIDSKFGVELAIGTSFDIKSIDYVYIDISDDRESGSLSDTTVYNMLKILVTCHNDYDKIKLDLIKNSIKDMIYSTYRGSIPVYVNSAIDTYMYFPKRIIWRDILNESGVTKSIGMVEFNYSKKY